MTPQRALRLTAWLVLAAIAFATLGPLGLRPRTDLPVSMERAAAFLGAGFLFALAYPRRIGLVIGFLIVAAIGLELLQNLRPDRHGQPLDTIAKLAGVCIGIGLSKLTAPLVARARQR